MKEFIEIPFGAKDSELCGWEYTIPEGFVASIENGKIVVKKEDTDDERIRKELVFYLGDMPEDTELRNGVTNRDVLAWLEKQGEQKPINDTDEEIVKAVKDTSVLDMVEPNPAWCEDDEEELDNIIDFLNSPSTAELCPTLRSNAIDWLNSLKDRLQPQWKPSEEQIQALEYQVNSTYKGSWQYKASKELLEQLKKL